MSLTFYYTPQSSADRVHASLQALGIPYDEVRVDLRAGDAKKPEFLALNPNAKVPLVVIDGTLLAPVRIRRVAPVSCRCVAPVFSPGEEHRCADA